MSNEAMSELREELRETARGILRDMKTMSEPEQETYLSGCLEEFFEGIFNKLAHNTVLKIYGDLKKTGVFRNTTTND